MAKRTAARLPAVVKQTAENRETGPAGTALANYTTTPSCGLDGGHGEFSGTDAGAGARESEAFCPDDARGRGWGGARNRRDRVSQYLTARQVYGMVAAGEFSLATKRPFQRHWTVHYERGGIDDRDGAAFVGRLLKVVGKAARRAGGEMTALWVRENGDGKGAHVHILLHLPEGMTLRGKTRRWLMQAGCPFPTRARVSKVRTIGGSLSVAGQNSEKCGKDRLMVRAYQLKGASAEVGAAMFLARSGDGGKVIGKRCGWSQNIGETARSKACEIPCRKTGSPCPNYQRDGSG